MEYVLLPTAIIVLSIAILLLSSRVYRLEKKVANYLKDSHSPRVSESEVLSALRSRNQLLFERGCTLHQNFHLQGGRKSHIEAGDFVQEAPESGTKQPH